ncbi:MAG: class I SAM-dependent methyltransferase [Synergistaceae bacterium]|jgi:2-polyprenyl-3-methyl-5-hydroxy-6-metoxy-1,4-benzoquinol methylase|nr:class I SAM-dependent methyltransferase [Synergistaceae bacterium]
MIPITKSTAITKITDRDVVARKTNHAFGVEEGHRRPYRLRQARYYELGCDVARWAWEHHQNLARTLDLLDVGTNDGVLRRYAEIHPGSEYIRYEAADIYPHGVEFVYKHADWKHHCVNLNYGMEEIAARSFDVVVCEQVLEHLKNYRLAMSELARVLRPNGLLVVGVPIFPAGLHLIRRHVVPVTDRLFNVKKVRGHIQAWSKRDFMKELKTACPDMDVIVCRGFRIVSGGVLKPLEHCRWWWRWNRWLGARVPSLCVEVQIIARKRRQEPAPDSI